MSVSHPDTSYVYRPFYRVRFAGARFRSFVEADNVVRATTQKSIGDAAGAWEVALDASVVSSTGSGKWSDVLVPNDYCDIAFGTDGPHPVHPYANPKIVMRGWVDNVRFGSSGEAKGSKQVVISGRDYGKVWLNARLLNIYPPVVTQAVALFGFYGLNDELTNVPHTKLWNDVMTKVMQPYVAKQQERINGEIPSFEHTTDLPDWLTLTQLQPETAMDTMYAYLHYHQALPWEEMFVRDDDDAPRFYLRWARIRSSDGKFYAPVGGTIQPPNIWSSSDEIDIMSGNDGFTDNEVYNWFGTTNEALGSINEDGLAAVFAPQNPYIVGTSIDTYGLKKLLPHINYFPVGVGASQDEIQQNVTDIKNLCEAFNIWLVRMYSFNYALKNGVATVLGFPHYRVGEEFLYLNEDQGGRIFYIEGVSHTYVEAVDGKANSGSLTTSLTLTRAMPYNGGSGYGLDYQAMSPYTIPTTNQGVHDAVTAAASSIGAPLSDSTAPAIAPTPR